MKQLPLLLLCLVFLILTGCQQNADKLAIIEVTPESANLHPGETQVFTAIGRNGRGEVVPIEPQWVLSENIGELSSTSGSTVTFTAATNGNSFLSVVAEGITGKTFVSVTELILTRIALTPEHLEIGVNQTFQFQLSGEDQFGAPLLPGQPTYELSGGIGSFDPETLTFSAAAVGTGILSLTVEGITIEAEIVVQEPVSIPDPALDSVLRVALGLSATADLFPYQLAKLENLTAVEQGISNLEGLQYCTGLQSLVLSKNLISDLAPLAGLTQLTGLYLDMNQIEDLNSISNLLNLEELSLAHNQLNNPELLANLLHLKLLDLTNVDLAHIDMLERMKDLRVLNLAYNHSVTDITALTGMYFLQSVNLSGTLVSDLTPLANKDHLQELSIAGTSVGSADSQLEPLSTCSALEVLHVDDSLISDLSPLAALTALRELKLPANKISDLSPLAGLINLQKLWLSANQVTDITVLTNLTNLQKLWLSDNQITDIAPLVANEGLAAGDYIYLDGNLLDLADGSDDRNHISVLESRGVSVYYLPGF